MGLGSKEKQAAVYDNKKTEELWHALYYILGYGGTNHGPNIHSYKDTAIFLEGSAADLRWGYESNRRKRKLFEFSLLNRCFIYGDDEVFKNALALVPRQFDEQDCKTFVTDIESDARSLVALMYYMLTGNLIGAQLDSKESSSIKKSDLFHFEITCCDRKKNIFFGRKLELFLQQYPDAVNNLLKMVVAKLGATRQLFDDALKNSCLDLALACAAALPAGVVSQDSIQLLRNRKALRDAFTKEQMRPDVPFQFDSEFNPYVKVSSPELLLDACTLDPGRADNYLQHLTAHHMVKTMSEEMLELYKKEQIRVPDFAKEPIFTTLLAVAEYKQDKNNGLYLYPDIERKLCGSTDSGRVAGFDNAQPVLQFLVLRCGFAPLKCLNIHDLNLPSDGYVYTQLVKSLVEPVVVKINKRNGLDVTTEKKKIVLLDLVCESQDVALADKVFADLLTEPNVDVKERAKALHAILHNCKPETFTKACRYLQDYLGKIDAGQEADTIKNSKRGDIYQVLSFLERADQHFLIIDALGKGNIEAFKILKGIVERFPLEASQQFSNGTVKTLFDDQIRRSVVDFHPESTMFNPLIPMAQAALAFRAPTGKADAKKNDNTALTDFAAMIDELAGLRLVPLYALKKWFADPQLEHALECLSQNQETADAATAIRKKIKSVLEGEDRAHPYGAERSKHSDPYEIGGLGAAVQNEGLRQAVAERDQAIDGLNGRLRGAEASNEALRTENARLTAEIAAQKAKLTASKKEEERLQGELTGAKQRRAQAEAESTGLREQLAQSQQATAHAGEELASLRLQLEQMGQARKQAEDEAKAPRLRGQPQQIGGCRLFACFGRRDGSAQLEGIAATPASRVEPAAGAGSRPTADGQTPGIAGASPSVPPQARQ
jgi:hypothetical protein